MVDYIELLRDMVPVSEDNGFVCGDQEKIFFFVKNSIPFNPLSLKFTLFVTEHEVYLIGSKREIELVKDYISYPVKFVAMDIESYLENYEIPLKEIKEIVEENEIYSLSYTTSSWAYSLNEIVDETDYVESVVSKIGDIKEESDIEIIRSIQNRLIDICDESLNGEWSEKILISLEESINNLEEVDSLLSPVGFFCDKETFLSDMTFEKKIPTKVMRVECNVRKGGVGVHIARSYSKNEEVRLKIKKVRNALKDIVKLIKPGMISKNAFRIVKNEVKRKLRRELLVIPGLPLGYIMPSSVYISPYSDEIIKEGMVFFFQVFIGMRDYGIKEGYMIEITSKGGSLL